MKALLPLILALLFLGPIAALRTDSYPILEARATARPSLGRQPYHTRQRG
jgi:hypothetical protein